MARICRRSGNGPGRVKGIAVEGFNDMVVMRLKGKIYPASYYPHRKVYQRRLKKIIDLALNFQNK